MKPTRGEAIKTITTHYIDGLFVESHGREVMDIIKPTNGQVIARVTLADEEDTWRAIARKGMEEGAEVLVGGEGHPEGFEAVLREAQQCSSM